jgi:hypothetical protein
MERTLESFVHDHTLCEIGAQMWTSAIDRAQGAAWFAINDNIPFPDPCAYDRSAANRA